MTNLTQLSLATDNHSLVQRTNKGLVTLTGLTKLNADYNMLLEDCDVAHLTGLVSLKLGDNLRVTNEVFRSFGRLTRLVVGVGACKKDLLVSLRSLTTLRSLSVNTFLNNSLLDRHVSSLTQLTELDICSNIDRRLRLGSLTLLKSLSLCHDCVLAPEDYASLPVSLRTLDLRGSYSFGGDAYTCISQLTNLALLKVETDPCAFVESGLLQHLSSLTELWLPFDKILSAALPKHLYWNRFRVPTK